MSADKSGWLLGGAQLGMAYGVANTLGRPSDAELDRLLATAVELGVSGLDTAPAYGDAEARIGAFFAARGWPAGMSVTTKLAPRPPTLAIDLWVAGSVEGSRRALARDRLDVVLIHAPQDLAEHGPRLIDALEAVCARGWVERYGISVYTAGEARAALACAGLGVIQYPFNLLDRHMSASGAAGELQAAGRRGVARSVLLQGLLLLDARALPSGLAQLGPSLDALQNFAVEHGLSRLELALGYARAQSGAQQLLLGAESSAQLVPIDAAWRRAHDKQLWAQLEAQVPPGAEDAIDPRRWPARSSTP